VEFGERRLDLRIRRKASLIGVAQTAVDALKLFICGLVNDVLERGIKIERDLGKLVLRLCRPSLDPFKRLIEQFCFHDGSLARPLIGGIRYAIRSTRFDLFASGKTIFVGSAQAPLDAGQFRLAWFVVAFFEAFADITGDFGQLILGMSGPAFNAFKNFGELFGLHVDSLAQTLRCEPTSSASLEG
jgi:hypothetical protein